MEGCVTQIPHILKSQKQLKIQMGQMANAINMRNQEELPNKTETNPHEHVKEITLRSGEDLSSPTKERKKEQVEEIKEENDEEVEDKNEMKEAIPIPPVPVPFPQRLNKQKDEKNFKKFLKIFKELHINIPFVDAVLQVSAYVKFLKELVTKKKREEFETIVLTEEYRAIIQNK